MLPVCTDSIISLEAIILSPFKGLVLACLHCPGNSLERLHRSLSLETILYAIAVLACATAAALESAHPVLCLLVQAKTRLWRPSSALLKLQLKIILFPVCSLAPLLQLALDASYPTRGTEDASQSSHSEQSKQPTQLGRSVV
eukprot:scaffold123128_cov19-Tisochrysis_lutea.AAC.1